MHAPAQFNSSGSKISKIAVVVLMHAGLIGALLSMKVLVSPAPPAPAVPVFPKTYEPKLPDPVPPPTVTQAPPPPIAPPSMPMVDAALPQEPTIIVDRFPQATEAPPALASGPAGGGTVAPAEPVKPQRVYMAALADAKACALPSYPAQSIRNGDTGTVTLALLIGADGKVSASRIQRSSGYKELDRAAIAALKLCAFKPATTNGVPEAAWGQIAYVWTLDN